MQQQEKKILHRSQADLNYWDKTLHQNYEPFNEELRNLSNRFVQLQTQHKATAVNSSHAQNLASEMAGIEKLIKVLAALPKINRAFLWEMMKKLFAGYQGDVDHIKFTYEDLLQGLEFEITFQEKQLEAKDKQIAALKAEVEELKKNKYQKPKKQNIYS